MLANIISNGSSMPFQFKIIVFIVASVGIFWVSRLSLHDFRSHGFYRFFAFEAIVALILLNVDYWFYKSFAGFCLALITSFFLILTAKIEEAENLRFFGAAYQSYMKRTKMFIPFSF